MRSALALCVLLATVRLTCADDKKWPETGSETPGSMSYLFNVTGLDAYKDRFHCLVTDYGLDPTVLVIVRGSETLENPATIKLLQELDSAVAKNNFKRLHAFVVVLDPTVKDIVKEDVPRYLLRKKVDALAKDEKNKLNNGVNVPLCLTSPNYLEKYPLDDDTTLLVVLYKNHRVQLSKTFAKDKLTEEDAAKLVAEGVPKILPPK